MNDMILRRRGNKSLIAKNIIPFFPFHLNYIEPFFGAGGMFFNKALVVNNLLNDNDSEIFNLFSIWKNKKDLLKEEISKIPIDQNIMSDYAPNTDIEKSALFLMKSNYTLFGDGKTLRTTVCENKKVLIENRLNDFFDTIKYCKFFNLDFREFIKTLSFRNEDEKEKTFIYADPPYLETNGNYDSFTEKDSLDLFNSLQDSKCKFAYSEFNHPFILEQAKSRNLNVIEIGERRNLGNRKTEILITNYETERSLFD